MFKNKLIYLFFLTFFILAILIDYTIYENKVADKVKDQNKIEKIIKKSLITIQFDSLAFGEMSFFEDKNSNFLILGNEISKKLSYLINKSDLKKFYNNNKFESTNLNKAEDKYFTINHSPITDDVLYGKMYFNIDVFTTIKDEAFTNYILEKLKLILQEDKDNFFDIINSLAEFFIYEEYYYKEYIKIIKNLDYNKFFINDISVFVSKNNVYVPDLNTRYYIFKTFIPVFTTLAIFIFFIFFIFLILIKNLKK